MTRVNTFTDALGTDRHQHQSAVGSVKTDHVELIGLCSSFYRDDPEAALYEEAGDAYGYLDQRFPKARIEMRQHVQLDAKSQ